MCAVYLQRGVEVGDPVISNDRHMRAADDMEGVFTSGIAAADAFYDQIFEYPVRAPDMESLLQIKPQCDSAKSFGTDFDRRGVQTACVDSDGISGEGVFPRREIVMTSPGWASRIAPISPSVEPTTISSRSLRS